MSTPAAAARRRRRRSRYDQTAPPSTSAPHVHRHRGRLRALQRTRSSSLALTPAAATRRSLASKCGRHLVAVDGDMTKNRAQRLARSTCARRPRRPCGGLGVDHVRPVPAAPRRPGGAARRHLWARWPSSSKRGLASPATRHERGDGGGAGPAQAHAIHPVASLSSRSCRCGRATSLADVPALERRRGQRRRVHLRSPPLGRGFLTGPSRWPAGRSGRRTTVLAATAAVPRRRRWRRNEALLARGRPRGRRPPTRRRRRARSRWPGCWRRARPWSRSRARAARPAWRRTPRRRTSC